jgi:hypothetical protein
VLSSPDVVPIASTTDCQPRGSDHCIVDVVAALPRV